MAPKIKKKGANHVWSHLLSGTLPWFHQNMFPDELISVARAIHSCSAGSGLVWWAYLDSNQGPTGYEPVALAS